MGENSEADPGHQKNNAAMYAVYLSVAVFVFSVYTHIQTTSLKISAEKAQAAANAAKLAAEETQNQIANLRSDSELQADLINYAQPHIARMAEMSGDFASACRVASAYAEIESQLKTQRIFSIMREILSQRPQVDPNDMCSGVVDAATQVIASVEAESATETSSKLKKTVPVVATYQVQNCGIALKAQRLFEAKMEPLYDGDSQQYLVAVSPTKARVVLNVPLEQLNVVHAKLRALGQEADDRVRSDNDATSFDRQNLRQAAGTYLAKTEGWTVISDENREACKSGGIASN